MKELESRCVIHIHHTKSSRFSTKSKRPPSSSLSCTWLALKALGFESSSLANNSRQQTSQMQFQTILPAIFAALAATSFAAPTPATFQVTVEVKDDSKSSPDLDFFRRLSEGEPMRCFADARWVVVGSVSLAKRQPCLSNEVCNLMFILHVWKR